MHGECMEDHGSTEMWNTNASTNTEYSISLDDIHIEFDNNQQASEEGIGRSNSAIEGSSGIAAAELVEQEQELQVYRRRRIGIVESTDKDVTKRRDLRVLRKKFDDDLAKKNSAIFNQKL